MVKRLSTVAPDLVATFERSKVDQLRRAASAAVRLAVTKTGLVDTRIDAAIMAIEEGANVSDKERAEIEALTEHLDEAQWDLQDEVEKGTVSEDEQIQAFRRARTAAATWCALDKDALDGALEAVYEANAAVGDLDMLRAVVESALS